MLSDLSKKSVNVGNVAEKALKNKKVFLELLEGILSKKETIRYNSFKVLLLISEEQPEVLYPQWDFFAKLLMKSVSHTFGDRQRCQRLPVGYNNSINYTH